MALPPEKLAQLKAAQKAAANQELEQSKEIINAQDIGYTSKLFVQALFPFRKTDEEKRVIETAQGRIVVYADGGLPYGTGDDVGHDKSGIFAGGQSSIGVDHDPALCCLYDSFFFVGFAVMQ